MNNRYEIKDNFSPCDPLFGQYRPGQNKEFSESSHYYMRDGLSDEAITSILQDSLGYIWVRTQSGLNKFDGYDFTSDENDAGSAVRLTNNVIKALWQDEYGRLWIGH